MNQAALFLPVNVLYTALQFLIKFYYFSKADELDQFYLFNEVHPSPKHRGGLGRGIFVPHQLRICCI
jgi:hypothetical protein